ncbi:Casein kinase substrate, phosphoprotein PP28 [Metarhizium album ARSEF 1941]|uniref:Casein kinase substrate, phosphoprotein PP28 n=1 Tax=Metarhizium album (strain ARSEF 1941) TaxID=1081103 RepID=A0A0B2X6Y6_METAS|nr:Casein kinase substrate, phosphoprotein PP28 [Metarhizium album ARSEF 1941]KHO01066.1 Casein kinase substrate, phosphoprotein PP28 [Metarhizium album ARSEF 1941]
MAGGSAAPRGRAGKFNKPTRGGGKHYSRSLQPVDADGNQVSMWSSGAADEPSDEEGSAEESSQEEEGDAADPSNAAAEAESRDDRKALKKARKEAAIAKQKSRTVEVGDMPSSDDESDDDMPANPNHSKTARKQTKSSDVDDITEGVQNMNGPGNRKEREAAEAAAAKEKYIKLQAEGKTDQAKADLARLRLIREQRAADAARRQAEKEEREEQEKVRKTEIEAKEAKKREAAAGPKKASKRK